MRQVESSNRFDLAMSGTYLDSELNFVLDLHTKLVVR